MGTSLTGLMEIHWLCSHDFIGEFTTSYRELARGQSHFNVYEVRGGRVRGHGCSAPPPMGVLVPLLHPQMLWSPGTLCCGSVFWGLNIARLGCYGPQGLSLCCTSVCQHLCVGATYPRIPVMQSWDVMVPRVPPNPAPWCAIYPRVPLLHSEVQ